MTGRERTAKWVSGEVGLDEYAAEVLWGVLPTPALGAVLMSASSVIVAVNARLLRSKKSPETEQPERESSNHPEQPKAGDQEAARTTTHSQA